MGRAQDRVETQPQANPTVHHPESTGLAPTFLSRLWSRLWELPAAVWVAGLGGLQQSCGRPSPSGHGGQCLHVSLRLPPGGGIP